MLIHAPYLHSTFFCAQNFWVMCSPMNESSDEFVILETIRRKSRCRRKNGSTTPSKSSRKRLGNEKCMAARRNNDALTKDGIQNRVVDCEMLCSTPGIPSHTEGASQHINQLSEPSFAKPKLNEGLATLSNAERLLRHGPEAERSSGDGLFVAESLAENNMKRGPLSTEGTKGVACDLPTDPVGRFDGTSKAGCNSTTLSPPRDPTLPESMGCSSSVMAGPGNINADVMLQEGAKYTIRFKAGEFERDYYMNDGDSLEIIYKSLFGDNREKRIFYEGMKLSRLLSAGECGFFPGINYIYLSDEDTLSILSHVSITIKFDDNLENDLTVALEPTDTFCSVLSRIESEKEMDLSEKCLIYNGIVLNEQSILSDLIDGDIIDVVDRNAVWQDKPLH